MKKFVFILLALVLLTGCGQSYEQVQDVYATEALPAAAELLVSLPPDAVALSPEEGTTLWLCDGYTAAVSIRQAGDLDATLRNATGYGRDQLEVLTWSEGGLKRSQCAFVSAGEEGQQVARTVVLDDGSYHYTLTLQTDADKASELMPVWQQMFSTVTLDIVP